MMKGMVFKSKRFIGLIPAICSRSFNTARRLDGLSSNVFAAFSALAVQQQSVNLGQGFPSFPSPSFLKVLAEMYTPLFHRNINAMSEIVTYSGAQSGIFAAIMAFVNAGEEVVCIEPYFDASVNAALLVDAKVKGVPLRPVGPRAQKSSSDWRIDPTELEKALTPNTRLLIINTPHNPIGKVMSLPELKELAAILRKHPHVILLSDEVYEFAVYDGLKHERIATLPDMFPRTISLYSAGKTFSATGWRVGYSIAPPTLSKPLLKVQAAINFCAPVPLEVGVAGAFRACMANDYLMTYPAMLQEKRDKLAGSLRNAGLHPIIPEGGYFTMADTTFLTAVKDEADDKDPNKVLDQRRDYRIARWLTEKIKLTGIPTSGFYLPDHREQSNTLLRFCHTKDDQTLSSAAKNLEKLSTICKENTL